MASNALLEVLHEVGHRHDHGLDPFGTNLAIYTLHLDEMGILLKRDGFVIDDDWLKKAIDVATSEGYPRFTITTANEGTELMFRRDAS